VAKTLTEIALDEELADRAALEEAAARAEAEEQPLVVELVRYCGVGEVALVAAIRRQIRVGITDPATVSLDSDALRELPREVCRRRRVLPLTVEMHDAGPRTIVLAMADPTDQVAIAEVEHVTGCQVEPTLMTLSAVEELIETGYKGFVTQVMKREPAPLRADRTAARASASKRARAPAGDPADTPPTTTPHHRIADEADVELRLRSLVKLLVDKGVIGAEELDEVVRQGLKRRDDDA